MPSWLNQHRKADLVALAQEAGLENLNELTKMELVSVLDEELMNNTQHQRNSSFTEYYNRRSATSPVKRESIAAAVASITSNGDTDSAFQPHGRRVSHVVKGEREPDSSEPLSSPVPPVLAPEQVTASHVPFPPSPADVADVIEEQTQRLEESLGDFWKSTNIMDLLHLIRAELSSVHGIHMSILVLEGYFLQTAILPWRYAFDIPAVAALGTNSIPVFLPDLFVLLTSYWWSTSLLWATMNLWLPLIAGWFCNLTLKIKAKDGVATWNAKYQVDPLTFSITKALLAWLVFQQGVRFGVFADETVDRTVLAMPVGYNGVMIAAYIGIVTSIWDGLQGRKSWY
ncbi:hypothetical protein MBLNU459_g5056t2 [Dothideomycetes sp. NU459]